MINYWKKGDRLIYSLPELSGKITFVLECDDYLYQDMGIDFDKFNLIARRMS